MAVVLIGGDWGRGIDEGLGRESTREAMESKMRDPYSLLSSYLKGSIQALHPQLVHVGVGNVIDQLHPDSVITSERSSKRVPLLVINRAQDRFIHVLPINVPCLLWDLVRIIV